MIDVMFDYQILSDHTQHMCRLTRARVWEWDSSHQVSRFLYLWAMGNRQLSLKGDRSFQLNNWTVCVEQIVMAFIFGSEFLAKERIFYSLDRSTRANVWDRFNEMEDVDDLEEPEDVFAPAIVWYPFAPHICSCACVCSELDCNCVCNCTPVERNFLLLDKPLFSYLKYVKYALCVQKTI